MIGAFICGLLSVCCFINPLLPNDPETGPPLPVGLCLFMGTMLAIGAYYHWVGRHD